MCKCTYFYFLTALSFKLYWSEAVYFTHSTLKCAKKIMRWCGIGLWSWNSHFLWSGVYTAPLILSAILHPFHWSKRHSSVHCFPSTGHQSGSRASGSYTLSLSFLNIHSHSIKVRCSAEPNEQILLKGCNPPQAMPEKMYHLFKCSWFLNACLKFLPHQSLSKWDLWEQKNADMGSALLPS